MSPGNGIGRFQYGPIPYSASCLGVGMEQQFLDLLLARHRQQLFFHFGFALMSNSFESDADITARYNHSKYLMYFRIQDHVRKMGFGRTALVNLLRQHKNKKKQTYIKIYNLKLFEERQNIKDIIGKKAEEIIKDSLFPKDDERKKFDILFDSVQKGIGFI